MLEASSAPNGYYGKITENGQLRWYCEHHHTREKDAEACAEKQLGQGAIESFKYPPVITVSRKIMSHSWQVNENVTFLADGDPTTSSAPVRIHIRNRPEACVLNRHGDDSWWSVDISWDELAEFVLGQLADRKIEEIEGADTWQDRAKALGL